MITVMGATGNTGKKITEILLKAGENVARWEERRANLPSCNAGAEVLPGDTGELAQVYKAM